MGKLDPLPCFRGCTNSSHGGVISRGSSFGVQGILDPLHQNTNDLMVFRGKGVKFLSEVDPLHFHLKTNQNEGGQVSKKLDPLETPMGSMWYGPGHRIVSN